MAEEAIRCVFKLGGSLLLQPDWPQRLRRWIQRQPPGTYLGIVGGGEFVDALRRLDEVHSLSTTVTHWQAIRLLESTYELACGLVPEFVAIDEEEEWQAVLAEQEAGSPQSVLTRERWVAWVNIGLIYRKGALQKNGEEDHRLLLPESWEATSDSLALWLARRVNAGRCVLFKSCRVEDVTSLDQARSEGIIDPVTERFEGFVPKIELHTL